MLCVDSANLLCIVEQEFGWTTSYYVRFFACYSPLLGFFGAAALYMSIRLSFFKQICFANDHNLQLHLLSAARSL